MPDRKEDLGLPIAVAFDHIGICYLGATLQRVWLGDEGVHALCLVVGDRVLVRRRFIVRRVPEWEWRKGELPTAA